MKDADGIGLIVLRQRKKLKLSLREVGKRAGVAHVTVRKFELGHTNEHKPDTVRRIIEAVGLDPKQLLGSDREVAVSWPLQASRTQIESLSDRDRSLLDSLVTTFVRECKRLDG